jgi:hypothetical protein
MPRPPALLLSIVLGAVFATGLASCGDDGGGEIPPENADAMLAFVGDARDAAAVGDCLAVENAAEQIRGEVNALPPDVDPELRSALSTGANNLESLARDPATCETTPAEPTTTTTTTTDEETTTTDEETTTTDEDEEGEEGEEEPPPEGEPPGQGQPPGPPTDGDSGTDGGSGGTGGTIEED